MIKLLLKKKMADTGKEKEKNTTGAKGRIRTPVYKKCKVCGGRRKEEDMEGFVICKDCFNKQERDKGSYYNRIRSKGAIQAGTCIEKNTNCDKKKN